MSTLDDPAADGPLDASNKPGSARSIASHSSKLPSPIEQLGSSVKPVKQQSNSNNIDYASLIDKIGMQCPIHRLDIVKVCTKKDCREKMFFCVECIEEFAEHVVKHRPFIPISQYLSELAENPNTQRKARVEALQNANSASVDTFMRHLSEEKSRIADVIIPALKSAMNEICDQLQNRIFDEIDHFASIYSYNSKYLTAYLDSKGLLAQILDQVPSFQNVYDKYEECSGSRNEGEFQEYLEKIHRRLLNDNSVEQTRQAFAYFEEIFDVFRQQGESSPKFIGEIDLMKKIEVVFNEFVETTGNKFSNEVSRYPICSGCNKELDKASSSLEALEKKYLLLLQSEEALKSKLPAASTTGPSLARGSTTSTSKLPANKAAATTGSASTAQQTSTNISKQTEHLKDLKAQIDRIKSSRPGCCKGCKRFYCVACQNESICYGCRIELDPQLKTSKFIAKESKGNFIAMLDDTTKQGPADVRRKTASLTAKVMSVSPLLKKLANIGIFIGNQEHFSGRLEWDIVVENYGSCHSIAFGICKVDQLKEELELNRDFKDFTQSKSLIMVATNGSVSGGLKGRVQTFQKEKNANPFTCVLDFGKNKFAISGKNVFLERDLENNQGYVPCFYSGCCFKSYNNLTIKQKFTYDYVPL